MADILEFLTFTPLHILIPVPQADLVEFTFRVRAQPATRTKAFIDKSVVGEFGFD